MQTVKAPRLRPVTYIAVGLAILSCLTGGWLNRDVTAQDVTVRRVPATAEHPLDPALRIARRCLRYIETDIADYSAVIVKRERVSGKLTDHQFLFAKIRNRKVDGDRVKVPFGVYLRFLKPKSVAGREVIWVEGENDGQLFAHEGGFFNLLRVKLDPDGFMAMVGQRYPITKIGFENLVSELIQRGERDRKRGGCEVKFFKNAKVEKRVCTKIEVTHPVERAYFDFYRAQIYIDNELKIPIRYAAWSWPESPGGPPILLEEYTYTQLKLNVGLTKKDFDPDNGQYKFP